MEKFFNKIHIIGSVGSGKTTLAKKLSTFYSIPTYEIDNLVWESMIEGVRQSSRERREELLKEIVQTEQWINEGSQYHWVNQSFMKADLIIILDVSYRRRMIHIVKRYLFQKIRIEQSDYRPSLKLLKQMLQWNKDYQNYERASILKKLEKYNDKVIVVSNRHDLKALVREKKITVQLK